MPFKIVWKQTIGNSGTLFEIELQAPLIAEKVSAGNFVMLRLNEQSERFPLFIADYDEYSGKITVVFQISGKSTKMLSLLKKGDEILDVVGPLGNKIELTQYDDPIIIIGGGIGIAECYLQAKELKKAGNEIISIISAKSKDLLIWKDRIYAVSDDSIVCTEDGSEGIKGNAIAPLKKILENQKISLVIVVGPLGMMEDISYITNGNTEYSRIKTLIALNTIMMCGMGVCGSCRYITKDNTSHFACTEGPIVDGHDVNYNYLLKRSLRYIYEEVIALKRYEEELNIISTLQKIQETYGRLPPDILTYLAKKLKVPLSEISNIVKQHENLFCL